MLCTCVGVFALYYNGVVHSTAFSAIIATTRNRELDEVSRGHSLGAIPLGYTGMKMRFGVLHGEGEKRVNPWDETSNTNQGDGLADPHIGFGSAERVQRLRKGGIYI